VRGIRKLRPELILLNFTHCVSRQIPQEENFLWGLEVSEARFDLIKNKLSG